MSDSQSAEQPFRIAILEEDITLLKKKLELTRFPDELEDAKRDYGVPLKDVQRLITYWKDGYDWRKHERDLNEELPQFTRDIEVEGFGPLNIHYVHKKSEVEGAIPLLFVHGWPGSFVEVRKILPLLVKASSEHPSFHVVTYSLPGYGFSEAPRKRGFTPAQYAEVGHKLMLALGYNEYVTQGGDWGAVIIEHIATKYGHKHNKAWHTNLPRGIPPTYKNPFLYIQMLLQRFSPADKAAMERSQWMANEGLGYFAEQSTQPQTLGYSLADSPAGLLAWIFEKLVNWSDEYPWTDDEVLTWISIYWFSRAGPSASTRIYYEFVKSKGTLRGKPVLTTLPLGYSYFPKEIFTYPRSWYKTPSLVFESAHESGGHFASYEKPEELVGDLRKMFGKHGPAFGVVPGHTGYIAYVISGPSDVGKPACQHPLNAFLTLYKDLGASFGPIAKAEFTSLYFGLP